MDPLMKHLAFAKGSIFLLVIPETVFPVRQALIVLPKMDSHWLSSRQNLDTGDQVSKVQYFLLASLDTIRWRLRIWPMQGVAQLIP